MKACCNTGERGRVHVASWLVPGGLLVLMPKCPACFAGYFALFSGVGVSLPVAAGLRRMLVCCCVAILMLAMAALIRRWWLGSMR